MSRITWTLGASDNRWPVAMGRPITARRCKEAKMNYPIIDIESSRERREERDQDELDDLEAERIEKAIRYRIKGDA